MRKAKKRGYVFKAVPNKERLGEKNKNATVCDQVRRGMKGVKGVSGRSG